MLLLIISSLCILGFVGMGSYVYYNKKKYDDSISNIELADNTSEYVDIVPLTNQIQRIESLKETLRQTRDNVEKLDIPIPESLASYDTGQSSLDKISRFSEKYSSTIAGTEQLVLSILPVSETGRIIASFAETFPEQMSDAAHSAITAMKDAAYIPTDMNEVMSMISKSMQHIDQHALYNALSNHNYASLITQPGKAMISEMSGAHEGLSDLSSSIGDIKDSFASSIDTDSLTDITDLDFSGHVPVMTIAMSSYREFQLITKNKTDALTSLKNIGLDAAGSGIGGLAGAKAGAIAGSFFGPLGTVIGGVVGSIGGAIGGKMFTNEIKQKPLKKAIEEYQSNYQRMKIETDEKSKETLSNIYNYTIERRDEFKNDKLLEDVPVIENKNILTQICISIYQYIIDYIDVMKLRYEKVSSSYWYKEEKHGAILNTYKEKIQFLETQLPPIDNIKENPSLAIESLLAIKMPKEIDKSSFEQSLAACTEELKQMNDKNDSSILIWSYMVNGSYQKAINDITEYNNHEMTSLNALFDNWKTKMKILGNDVDREKGKLGLN